MAIKTELPVASTLLATSCPTPPPDEPAQFEADSVAAEDSGEALVIHQPDRFSVHLDEGVFPVSDLRVFAAGILGGISNGSVRGPSCHPILFEGVTEGKARLSDRSIRLQVVVDNRAPASTLPLH